VAAWGWKVEDSSTAAAPDVDKMDLAKDDLAFMTLDDAMDYATWALKRAGKDWGDLSSVVNGGINRGSGDLDSEGEESEEIDAIAVGWAGLRTRRKEGSNKIS
jgi:hypothetical protein